MRTFVMSQSTNEDKRVWATIALPYPIVCQRRADFLQSLPARGVPLGFGGQSRTFSALPIPHRPSGVLVVEKNFMKTFQPADHLKSRTFIGLLVAQFFAAFNDQAIHAAAMFYAINTATLSEAQAIGLMPILFYAPWAIFCTVAGWLSDRYSKQKAFIIWKMVEVAVCLLALYGFWLGRNGAPSTGAWIVLVTVFLMGMHSAFFVPAKYGAMPEILTPRMLSKGNGLLESLSFLAVILGTVFGGVLSFVFLRHEYMIGIILVILAIVGAVASLLIENIPPANPNRTFPPYIYQPLFQNIKTLLVSRPLIFAVVGIAFFTFLVSYMRAVVYMHGQSQVPRWSEAYTSLIVGMVALGIGVGSPLVGWLSGGKVEIGLVPIGAVGMVIATTLAGIFLFQVWVLVLCIILIGFFTGFYLVPLFSLLQHRAPKTSKGDSIATSNFINITGAILSSLLLVGVNAWGISSGFTPRYPSAGAEIRGTLTEPPEFGPEGHMHKLVVDGQEIVANDHPKDGSKPIIFRETQGIVHGAEIVIRPVGNDKVTYYHVQPASEAEQPLYDKSKLPEILFWGGGLTTAVTLLLLWFFLSDLFQRTRIWAKTRFAYHLEVAGMLRLPGNGPVIVVHDADNPAKTECLLGALDRVVHQVPPADLATKGKAVLATGGVVGVPVGTSLPAELLQGGVQLLPVHCHEYSKEAKKHMYVVAGHVIAAQDAAKASEELVSISVELKRKIEAGEPLEKDASGH
jgi:MFS family permease